MDSAQSDTLFNRLLPRDPAARAITLRMLIPVLLAYLGRILLHQAIEQTRESFGVFTVLIYALACLLGAALVALIVWLAIRAARKARHAAPALVLIGGIVLVRFLPLPPLPAIVFPEQKFFAAHRADFEAVVDLARLERLDCPVELGCATRERELPTEYRYLSDEGRVWVSGVNTHYMTVKFQPFEFYYPVIYFQTPSDAQLSNAPDCHHSRYTRRLDDHWFLCIYELHSS
jgi:hypothetical protein